MNDVLSWLRQQAQGQIQALADLVAIPSISTDGAHAAELERSAACTCALMRQAGLQHVTLLRNGDSYPYAYGEWLGAPGKPTVFLYAHHDVQPVNDVGAEKWLSDPWQLTERNGRLYGRGAADDKGAIVAQLWAVAAFLKTRGHLPVNVKMLVEGEEEVGSRNLQAFFHAEKERLHSDVIVVCDTETLEVGLPCITYSLRGILNVLVEVESATKPNHSGLTGGLLADAALALDVLLARLYDPGGQIPIPHFYDRVRPLTPAERQALQRLPGNPEQWRREFGVLDGVAWACPADIHPYEQTWRRPAITLIAQEASSLRQASNQVLPRAAAIVSCRLVPDQDPEEVYRQLQDFLTHDPPWKVHVRLTSQGAVDWWMTDPQGPAFEAALEALRAGYGREPLAIGCGGSIGFVGPLAALFGGAPALLLGIEDPQSNAHAPNESLHLDNLQKLTASLAHLFDRLGQLSPEGLRR
jgi:acetylornithine deacetylase/succinyl-diaminopimelate desuccinylase-like protein